MKFNKISAFCFCIRGSSECDDIYRVHKLRRRAECTDQ